MKTRTLFPIILILFHFSLASQNNCCKPKDSGIQKVFCFLSKAENFEAVEQFHKLKYTFRIARGRRNRKRIKNYPLITELIHMQENILNSLPIGNQIKEVEKLMNDYKQGTYKNKKEYELIHPRLSCIPPIIERAKVSRAGCKDFEIDNKRLLNLNNNLSTDNTSLRKERTSLKNQLKICNKKLALSPSYPKLIRSIDSLENAISIYSSLLDTCKKELRTKGPITSGKAELFNKMKIKTEVVFFDFNKYQLKPTFLLLLNKLAKELSKCENCLIDIYGFADAVGSDRRNFELGFARAKTVKLYLMSRGITEVEIFTDSFGKIGEGVNNTRKAEIHIYKLESIPANKTPNKKITSAKN